jgi:tetratricopeptide (TPR) repeat protein
MKRISLLLVLLLSVSIVGIAQEYDDPQVQADLIFNEGNSFLRAGNFAEAVSKYNEALNIVKDHRYYYQKAIALLRLQRFEDSISAFNSALQHGSEMETVGLGLSGAYMGRGEELFSAGNYSGAITQYRRAIETNPDPRYYNRLAIALRRTNQEAQAVEAFQKAIELDPEYAVAYAGLGGTFVSMQRFNDAIETYKKAIELEPGMQQARVGLAASYTSQGNEHLNRGRAREAISVLQEAVTVNPQYHQAHLLLAVAFNRVGQPQDAEQHARRAIEFKQRGRMGGEYFELGVALKYQGRRQEAISAFQEAAKDPTYRRNAEYELEELRR